VANDSSVPGIDLFLDSCFSFGGQITQQTKPGALGRCLDCCYAGCFRLEEGPKIGSLQIRVDGFGLSSLRPTRQLEDRYEACSIATPRVPFRSPRSFPLFLVLPLRTPL